jgi:hypothetical protein
MPSNFDSATAVMPKLRMTMAVTRKLESRLRILVQTPELSFQGKRAIVLDHTVLDSLENPDLFTLSIGSDPSRMFLPSSTLEL